MWWWPVGPPGCLEVVVAREDTKVCGCVGGPWGHQKVWMWWWPVGPPECLDVVVARGATGVFGCGGGPWGYHTVLGGGDGPFGPLSVFGLVRRLLSLVGCGGGPWGHRQFGCVVFS